MDERAGETRAAVMVGWKEGETGSWSLSHQGRQPGRRHLDDDGAIARQSEAVEGTWESEVDRVIF